MLYIFQKIVLNICYYEYNKCQQNHQTTTNKLKGSQANMGQN